MRLSTTLFALAALGTALTIPTAASARRINPNHAPQAATAWVPSAYGMGIPRKAFRGGREPARDLYVCRARHQRGLHPGKIVAGRCNIGWGGKEILLNTYDVLTVRSRRSVKWLPSWSKKLAYKVPVRGGFEPGRTLNICRARYKGGMHPGKVVAGRCNIGWGGREIVLSRFQVLVHRNGRRVRPSRRVLRHTYTIDPMRIHREHRRVFMDQSGSI